MQEVRDKANANLSTCRHGHKASILMMPRTHPWNQSFTKWVTMTRTIIPEETTGQKLLFAFGIRFKDHAYPAHWQQQDVGESTEQKQFVSFMLVGMQNSMSTLEYRWTICNQTLMTYLSHNAPLYVPEWVKIFCLDKNSHVHVYSSFNHNAKTWKQPSDRWV